MRKRSFWLALGLGLLLLAVPVVLYAQATQVYVDTTNTLSRDTNQQAGSQANPFTSLSDGLTAMANKSGTIVYVFNGSGGVQFCDMPISNGSWTGRMTNCRQGIPPGTGEPIAPVLVWAFAALAALVLIGTGVWLRTRGLPTRSAA